MNAIRLFMWGYQPYFQISTQTAAQGIFDQLDKALSPTTFLVGVIVEEGADRYPICVEPEDCGYDPKAFSDVQAQAEHLEAVEERPIFHSHPKVQENHEQRIKLRALKNAIQQAVRRYDEYRGVVSFCSWPVLVEGYRVCVVLQFNRDAFESHYALVRNKVDGRYQIATSLADATITEYFSECAKALYKPDPGSGLGLTDRPFDEIIRAAGKSLMYTPAWAGGEGMGLHGLFRSCNTISSLRYEGAEGTGKMLIARREHPNVEIVVALSSPVEMQDYRAVRKLLEMSSEEMCLLSDSGYVYGLGKLTGLYDQRAEDLFLISFTKHYTWELSHAGHTLMKVVYGQPELPRTPINKEKFERDIHRIFPDIGSKQIGRLWDLTAEAIKQKHGTMVVVSTGARIEAERLKTQSTTIEPFQLTPRTMQMITAIDGAVLIDPDSNCYAIGVILDGLASRKGTPSRGARYNSAIRYVESSKHPCVAVVVSEDGSIDLVPDLLLQIRRSEILEAIEQLRELKEEENFDLKTFNRTMSWLSDHRFYLLPEMCEEINRLRREVEAVRDRLVEPTVVRPLYSDFVANEEMNESYFLNESD